MDLFTASPLGWVLLCALGLRHGLDPDHIAVIDGLSLGAGGRRAAKWTGFLFSAGHGASFTLVTVAAGVAGARLAPSPAVSGLLDWASILLLAGLGAGNLLALLRPGEWRPVGWRIRLLRRLPVGGAAGPVAAGVVFGLMFDTAVQAAALGVAAAAVGGAALALAAGVLFSAAMSVTDGLDGLLLARALRGSDPEGVRRYRRGVGWVVVGLSFGMAGLELAAHFGGLEAEGDSLTALGGGAAALAIAAGWLSARRRRAAA